MRRNCETPSPVTSILLLPQRPSAFNEMTRPIIRDKRGHVARAACNLPVLTPGQPLFALPASRTSAQPSIRRHIASILSRGTSTSCQVAPHSCALVWVFSSLASHCPGARLCHICNTVSIVRIRAESYLLTTPYACCSSGARCDPVSQHIPPNQR